LALEITFYKGQAKVKSGYHSNSTLFESRADSQ